MPQIRDYQWDRQFLSDFDRARDDYAHIVETARIAESTVGESGKTALREIEVSFLRSVKKLIEDRIDEVEGYYNPGVPHRPRQ